MKSNFKIVRWACLVGCISFIIACRYMPALAEWYAREVYPTLSATLSAFSSLFPFSLEEIVVVSIILWLVLYPIRKRKKDMSWRKILLGQAETLAWVYVWFYLGWGLNYFRYNIYTRMQTPPVAYEEQRFKNFLKEYTELLNATYQPHTEIDADTLKKHISGFYAHLPSMYGLTKPKAWQEPKKFILTSLYSKVGVLGSMGPFFAEAQLNADLPEVQYPFTYAHEFSHLLGVSNEAEANYWAYRACTESDITALQYCGYFGLLPYVISNASHLFRKKIIRHGYRPSVPRSRSNSMPRTAIGRSAIHPL